MLQLSRRYFIVLLLALGACAQLPAGPESQPPIVFVHGNGDTAALWTTTVWRFESNGYDRKLLHAVDFRYPLARSDARFNDEYITVQNWPAKDGHIVFAEFHY